MKIIQQPIENCYWVVPGKFLAGEYPRNKDEESSRVKIDALFSAGVNAFIDLTEKDEDLLPYTALLEKASHERFPIRDVSVPNSVSTTVTILNTIDLHILQDRVLMRLAPVPMFFAADPEEAIRMSAESSKPTNGAETCLDACRYFGGLIVLELCRAIQKSSYTLIISHPRPASGSVSRYVTKFRKLPAALSSKKNRLK